MGWTKWRKIADRHQWYSDDLDWDGPACYELATAGPRGGNLQTHYVGETSNERERVANYARTGSHLEEIVDWHLSRRWSLWYRAQATRSKAAAKALQNRLLDQFDYDWNRQLNMWGKR